MPRTIGKARIISSSTSCPTSMCRDASTRRSRSRLPRSRASCRELQLGIDRDGNRERVQAALTKQLTDPLTEIRKHGFAVARPSTTQAVFQPFGPSTAFSPGAATFPCPALPAVLTRRGKMEAVYHPLLRHKGA